LLVMMLVPSKGVAIMIKTDTQLQTDVMAELQWDPQINASHIGVQVNDGVVTLSGVVTDAPQKWCAERAALRVDGVQALAVELTVALPDAERRSDSDISHAAATALQLMGLLKGHAIKVMVENGWITLSGDVEWTTSASRHAFAAPSVWCDRHKQCHQPAQQTHQLCGAAAVQTALKRRAIRDIDSITVSIDGPDVVLGGSVHSWSEQALATWHAAAGMPGVRNVIDNIRIVI
jgi:osmotically-inducible protein OsmY